MKLKWISASIMLANLITPIAHAQYAPTHHQGNASSSYYYQWCDQVAEILRVESAKANFEYKVQEYRQAKETMKAAFKSALYAASLPGTFRPYTYREIERSIRLIEALEALPLTQDGGSVQSSQNRRDKSIAYVALNRVDFVSFVKNSLDRDFVIPCSYGCEGGADRFDGFEEKLAEVARQQLNTALDYSTRTIGDQTYPLESGPVFFTIIAKTARWVAQDLSYDNFYSTAFSCAIGELRNIGAEAASYEQIAGDPIAVNTIYNEVNHISDKLSESPWGCHGSQDDDTQQNDGN